MSKYNIIEHIHSDANPFEIIKYSKILKDNKTYINDDIFKLKGDMHIHTQNSVAVASAITAYGRIYLSQFKSSNDNSLLYTDTDSLFLTKPLPSEIV